ncbi:MAG: hypothetical protein ABI120_18275, partial [Gemmatimonadaceae bacterium]
VILRAACGDEAVRNNTAVLFGSLHDSLGQSATGTVTARWQGNIQIASSMTANARMGWNEASRGAFTNERGEFNVCDVPRRSIVVKAENEAGIDERFLRLDEKSLLVELPLQPRHQAGPSLDAAESAMRSTTAFVEVRVSNSDGRPMNAIHIEVENTAGKRRKVTTDALGRVLLLDRPTGRTMFKAVDGANSELVEQTLVIGRNVVSLRAAKR